MGRVRAFGGLAVRSDLTGDVISSSIRACPEATCAREDIFFARERGSDVGVRAMPGNIVRAEPLCNEGKFAEKISRFAKIDCDVSYLATMTCILDLPKLASFCA